jgi:uncharacterized membrane protein YeaQ/YmgE (transglycosylase-associated protein family)
MDWLITLIIGGVVGWLASLLMKADAQMGLIANVLIGIVGSLLGYWLAGLVGVAPTGGIARWVVAVVGAALLIFILRRSGFQASLTDDQGARRIPARPLKCFYGARDDRVHRPGPESEIKAGFHGSVPSRGRNPAADEIHTRVRASTHRSYAASPATSLLPEPAITWPKEQGGREPSRGRGRAIFGGDSTELRLPV